MSICTPFWPVERTEVQVRCMRGAGKDLGLLRELVAVLYSL
jgi:hypothetical protein